MGLIEDDIRHKVHEPIQFFVLLESPAKLEMMHLAIFGCLQSKIYGKNKKNTASNAT